MKTYKCIICDNEFEYDEKGFETQYALCSEDCCNKYVYLSIAHRNKMDDIDLDGINEIRKSKGLKEFDSIDMIDNSYYSEQEQ